MIRLVAGTADSDIGPQLRDLGIGYLWVTGARRGRDVPDRQHVRASARQAATSRARCGSWNPPVARYRAGRPGQRRAAGRSPPVRRTARCRRPGVRIGEASRSALAGRARRPGAGAGRRRLAAGVRRSVQRRDAGLVAGSPRRLGAAGSGPACCWSRRCSPPRASAGPRSVTRPSRPGGPPPCRSWSDGRLIIRGTPPGTRRAVVLVAVLVGLMLIVGGGTLVTAQAPAFRPSRIPLVGRTTTICSVAATGER